MSRECEGEMRGGLPHCHSTWPRRPPWITSRVTLITELGKTKNRKRLRAPLAHSRTISATRRRRRSSIGPCSPPGQVFFRIRLILLQPTLTQAILSQATFGQVFFPSCRPIRLRRQLVCLSAMNVFADQQASHPFPKLVLSAFPCASLSPRQPGRTTCRFTPSKCRPLQRSIWRRASAAS
jgi:hypothetical protein